MYLQKITINKSITIWLSLGFLLMTAFAPSTSFAAPPPTPGVPVLTSGSDLGSSNSDKITSDTTPTYTISCENTDTVDLLVDNLLKDTGTCVSNTVSLTSGSLSDGGHFVTARQSNIDGEALSDSEVVDSTGDVGSSNSMVIAPDGFARISYYDITNNSLKYVRCTNINCTTSNIRTVDPVASNQDDFDIRSSMKLGSDGFARIAYADFIFGDPTAKSLKYLICNDADCSSPAISTVDLPVSGVAGKHAQLVLDDSDNPFIVFHRGGGSGGTGKLILARFVGSGGTGCTNTAWKCTAVDSSGGLFASIALGSDGFPRISYSQHFTDVNYVKCLDSDCVTKNIILIDGTAESKFTSLVLDSDDIPSIAYGSDISTDIVLKFARCSDQDCSSINLQVIDSLSQYTGHWISAAMGNDGLVKISYADYSNEDLKYAECNNVNCTAPNIITLDSTGNVGKFGTALDIGADGFLRIAYRDTTNANLKFYSPHALITIDTAAPAYSSVTPASSSSIDNVTSSSDISYTLSDGIASGQITITQTGGTPDPSSPHTCNLTGTALLAGTHTIDLSDTTNGCGTDTSNLMEDSIYTFLFSGMDVAGNSSSPVNETAVTFNAVAPVDVSTPEPHAAEGGSSRAAVLSYPIAPQGVPQIPCTQGALFSTITGLPCTAISTPPLNSPTSPSDSCTITLTLKIKSTGEKVKCLQQYLNSHGFTVSLAGAGSSGKETIYFGVKTKSSVILFQKSKGLISDGVVGPKTRAVF